MGHEIVQLGDRSIAVQQVGSGPTIVFVHGNSCSSRVFGKQLDSPLAKRFRLVAIDLPGHGDSPPAPDPDAINTVPGYATTVARAAEKLDAGGALFVGWSLGGHVLLEAAEQLPKAAGLLISGAPPVASLSEWAVAATDDPAVGPGFRADSTDDEVRGLVALFVRPGMVPPELFFSDFRRTDPRARVALAASAGRGELRDEKHVIASLKCPLAIVQGTHNRIARNRGWFDGLEMPTLWRGAVQDVPDAGHAPHWEAPDMFNRLLEDFALDCHRRP